MAKAKKTVVGEVQVSTAIDPNFQTAAAIREDFQLGRSILFSIIKKQAGTLSKAILELVMNSIDAGASAVHVTLSGTALSVADDGKGFGSLDEVTRFFKTFGTPHAEGDATYGRFRMGRGQLMAFTRNTWRSGQFKMTVDIRDKGLSYDFETGLPGKKGCSIDAEMYDPLAPSAVIQIIDDLRKLCRFTPCPVFVNGQQISIDPQGEKWTQVDDDAYYLMRQNSRQLEVYNLGVHVCNYDAGQYGVGGIIVSKAQLEVNFARNDILVSECNIWKRVAKNIRQYAKQFEEKKPVQNEAYRELQMGRILSGSFESGEEWLEALETAKVFTEYQGKQYSLFGLIKAANDRCSQLVQVDDHSLTADRVVQRELALVLSPKTIERGRHMSFGDMLERIKSNAMGFSYGNRWTGTRQNIVDRVNKLASFIRDLKDVSETICDKHDLVDEKDLSKEEKLALRVIRSDLQRMVRFSIIHNCRNDDWNGAEREIRVCRSESVNGFTDGRSVIYIEQKFLKIGGTKGDVFAAFERVKHLLLHEYLHLENTASGHGHPAEFYETYHEVARSHHFAKQTFHSVNVYIQERQKAGFKFASGFMHAMDLMASDAGALPETSPENTPAANGERIEMVASVSRRREPIDVTSEPKQGTLEF